MFPNLFHSEYSSHVDRAVPSKPVIADIQSQRPRKYSPPVKNRFFVGLFIWLYFRRNCG
jgi:hypothetical protein